jgi:hypothetical protein
VRDLGPRTGTRIKAILAAADNPLGSVDLSIRFQVRIWLVDDATAKKVATIYNTRGDKVNDSIAKYAYSETKEQEVARRLVNGSEHLGQETPMWRSRPSHPRRATTTLFSWHNPNWVAAGVVTPSESGTGTLGTRNSFPARRAAIRVLRQAMNLSADPAE